MLLSKRKARLKLYTWPRVPLFRCSIKKGVWGQSQSSVSIPAEKTNAVGYYLYGSSDPSVY